ncbi:Gmad2 immunoglobulin-like domain-containing protein [Solwaraspora sp. WMMB335]|uniref:Gmad2 immunoglobulin-like domain-containing protein n=1 Tax=Solwaraspora sp. WMMB335 TaxID=3404118 RepID=UPI003B930281
MDDDDPKTDDFAQTVLRRELHRHAARVDVRPDALPVIRERITARRRRRLPVTLLGTAVATAAAAMVGVVGCLPPTAPPGPPPGAATATPVPSSAAATGATAEPGPGGTVAGSATGTPTAGGAGEQAGATVVTLPVYYAGEVDGRLRLYREFHQFELTAAGTVPELRAAITEMLTAARLRDPDYRTLWPTGAAVSSVWTQYGMVGVNIADARVANLDEPAAQAAVQQLAWTVAGVVGGDPEILLLIDGEPVPRLWGHVDTSQAFTKAPALDALGLLWLIEPQHGATVRGTFTVHLAGSVFEATAQLRVRRGNQVVHEQFVTLDAGAPGRGEASVELTLPPGDYTVEAYEESMVSGGGKRNLVDADVTVR